MRLMMAAPGPHRPDPPVSRRPSFIGWIRTEWFRHKDGNTMRRVSKEEEDKDELTGLKRRHSFADTIRRSIRGKLGERDTRKERHSSGPSTSAEQKQVACTSEACPCHVVKEYTRKMSEEKKKTVQKPIGAGTQEKVENEGSKLQQNDADIDRNSGENVNESGKAVNENETKEPVKANEIDSHETTRPTSPKANDIDWSRPKLSDVKEVLAEEAKSKEKIKNSVDSTCKSENCPCQKTKEFTARILEQDRLQTSAKNKTTMYKRALSEGDERIKSFKDSHSKTELEIVQSSENGDGTNDKIIEMRNKSTNQQKRRRRASEPSKALPPMDRDMFRQLAREYNLKKQGHKTKRVLGRDSNKQSWHLAKYKTLVEIRDSIPDILQAAIEEKERRRDEKKDMKKARTKAVLKSVQDAAFSNSDYAMRRRAAVPFYYSYPSKEAPPIPTLMSKLPNPPKCFKENGT